MARPGTWKPEELLKMWAEIQQSESTIKDYCDKHNIRYHKLYQAFRRNSIVGEYAKTVNKAESAEKSTTPASV